MTADAALYPDAPTPSELFSDHQESILIIGDGALAASLLCPFMVLILQMEKLRLREVKPLVQGTQQAINDAQGGIPVYPAAEPPCCLLPATLEPNSSCSTRARTADGVILPSHPF